MHGWAQRQTPLLMRTTSLTSRCSLIGLFCGWLLGWSLNGFGATAELNPSLISLLSTGRVVFVGDSITYGGGYVEALETAFRIRYPESRCDWINVGLPSETLSGLSEPGHAGGQFPRPDLHERLSRLLEKLHPQLLVVCYGMNDGIYHPFSEERFARFRSGMELLREKASKAGAAVLHLTPPVFDPLPIKEQTLGEGLAEYRRPYVGYNGVLDRYSEWLVSMQSQGWNVVDIHRPMNEALAAKRVQDPRFAFAGDGVHLNGEGHWIVAREVLRALGWSAAAESRSIEDLVGSHSRWEALASTVKQRQGALKDAWLTEIGHLRPGMGKGMPLAQAIASAQDLGNRAKALAAPFPGKLSEWNSYPRYDFEVSGRPVLVVAPKESASGRPWVWHGEFFGHKPDPDKALLARGFHVVYMTVPNMLGSPEAVELWNAFYRELTAKYHFSPKAALVGLSRGGLYCYNWAAANPDKVACIYGDAPVCDLKSWPGGKGKGQGRNTDWKLALERYPVRDEAEAMAYKKNPIDNLEPLARNKVPLLHVYGDADDIVPWDENTGVLAERYRDLGGSITLIAKKGVGHHPHGLEDSTPIIDFLYQHATAAAAAASAAGTGH